MPGYAPEFSKVELLVVDCTVCVWCSHILCCSLFVTVGICNGNLLDLIGFNGTFQLANDASNRDCQWQIRGNVGFKVMVMLVIQNNKKWQDFVTFRDGDSSGPVIARVYEFEGMETVVSCSNSLFVRHSNVYGASNLAFTASFSSIGK